MVSVVSWFLAQLFLEVAHELIYLDLGFNLLDTHVVKVYTLLGCWLNYSTSTVKQIFDKTLV